MKPGLISYRFIFCACTLLLMSAEISQAACSPVFNRTVPNLLGDQKNLCEYQGKVVLVVNTASKCGFTYQYKGLEALYKKYKDSGFAILGFPSNDFGRQEPGDNKEVAKFCEVNYGVTFPMFEKTSVLPGGNNPFYDLLADATGEWPKWNFHKYLIDRSGKPVKSFASTVDPDDAKLIAELESLLARKP
jgi:glutathione peroxidase